METLSLTERIRARIRAFRTQAGYSQSQMAALLHMDERNYKRIESGEKKVLDTDLLERYCTVLQLPVDSLLQTQESLQQVSDIVTLQLTALRKLVESIASLEQVLQPPAENPNPPRKAKEQEE